MALGDELRDIEAEERRAKAELDLLRNELALSRRELDRAEEIRNLISTFSQVNLTVPKWTRDTAGKAGKKAIATLQLSDTHFDEVIESAQIAEFNAYNRRIATLRLKALGVGTIKVARDYIAGVQYEGAVIIATGDIFSGDIHDELKQTNEGTLFEGVVYWVPQVIAFLRLLADDFGKVHVAAVVGNHGRMTQKPIYKNRPQSNIEWLFWHWVADRLSGDPRFSFLISDGLSDTTTVYSTRYEFEHGDEFRGGSGIAGARSPLLLGQHRTAVQRMAMGTPFEWMVVGHFHQYQPPSQGLIMGGSLKGYDEYASGKHFRPERPQQGFWVTSPEHGPTISAPILVQDRKAEGW